MAEIPIQSKVCACVADPTHKIDHLGSIKTPVMSVAWTENRINNPTPV
jgi:hypothetical protein